MAPNLTDTSLSSNKSTLSKQSHKAHATNSVDRRFYEETLTVIQYTIYSFLSRPTNSSPSPVDRRFHELVSEILDKHDVYSCVCVNLHFTPSHIVRDFHGVTESMFEDGCINWGRLVALVGFSVKVAEYFRSQGYENQDDVVAELTSNFIVQKAGTWIMSRGGWKDVVIHFPKTNRDSDQFTIQNNGWFKGILMTATATIGLGALFAVTCK